MKTLAIVLFVTLELSLLLTPDKSFIVITLSLCYLAWSRHRFVAQFNGISPRAMTFGIIGHLRELRCQREGSVSAIVHEHIQSFPLLNPSNKSGLISLFVGPVHIMHATTLETVQAILTHKQTQSKGPHYRILRYGIGDGLIASSGDRWQQHRKLLTPAFHFQILRSLVPIVRNKTQVLMDRIEKSNDPNEKHEKLVSNLTLDVLCQSSLGIDIDGALGSGLADQFSGLFEAFAVLSMSPWMWIRCTWSLFSTGRQYVSCSSEITARADEVIQQRIHFWTTDTPDNQSNQGEETISNAKKRDVFIDLLIREHLENPSCFSIGDIIDETKTFLWAGQDSTAVALGYTFLLLGNHPEVQAAVHEEIDLFYADHSDDDLTTESIKNFVYLDAVLNETLRLYPPAPIIARVAAEDIVIEGQYIPKGTELAISVVLLHMNAKYWPDPHRFKPERFLNQEHHPFAFIPFSAGPRNCIGQKYAMISMKCFIILLFKHFSVKSITQISDVTPRFGPIFAPIEPLEFQFVRRSERTRCE